MKRIPFDPSTDIPPTPFDQKYLQLALEMKKRGLSWKPHVGCFVWDREGCIEAESPFPLRIYLILSLPRFISIFGNLETLIDRVVWLPTWHQAFLRALDLGVDLDEIAELWSQGSVTSPGDELMGIYRLIIKAL